MIRFEEDSSSDEGGADFSFDDIYSSNTKRPLATPGNAKPKTKSNRKSTFEPVQASAAQVNAPAAVSSRKSPPKSKFGVEWQDDKAVQTCSLCASSFSFVRRKHHCRKCGKVVCGKCCRFRRIEAARGEQRVCDACDPRPDELCRSTRGETTTDRARVKKGNHDVGGDVNAASRHSEQIVDRLFSPPSRKGAASFLDSVDTWFEGAEEVAKSGQSTAVSSTKAQSNKRTRTRQGHGQRGIQVPNGQPESSSVSKWAHVSRDEKRCSVLPTLGSETSYLPSRLEDPGSELVRGGKPKAPSKEDSAAGTLVRAQVESKGETSSIKRFLGLLFSGKREENRKTEPGPVSESVFDEPKSGETVKMPPPLKSSRVDLGGRYDFATVKGKDPLTATTTTENRDTSGWRNVNDIRKFPENNPYEDSFSNETTPLTTNPYNATFRQTEYNQDRIRERGQHETGLSTAKENVQPDDCSQSTRRQGTNLKRRDTFDELFDDGVNAAISKPLEVRRETMSPINSVPRKISSQEDMTITDTNWSTDKSMRGQREPKSAQLSAVEDSGMTTLEPSTRNWRPWQNIGYSDSARSSYHPPTTSFQYEMQDDQYTVMQRKGLQRGETNTRERNDSFDSLFDEYLHPKSSKMDPQRSNHLANSTSVPPDPLSVGMGERIVGKITNLESEIAALKQLLQAKVLEGKETIAPHPVRHRPDSREGYAPKIENVVAIEHSPSEIREVKDKAKRTEWGAVQSRRKDSFEDLFADEPSEKAKYDELFSSTASSLTQKKKKSGSKHFSKPAPKISTTFDLAQERSSSESDSQRETTAPFIQNREADRESYRYDSAEVSSDDGFEETLKSLRAKKSRRKSERVPDISGPVEKSQFQKTSLSARSSSPSSAEPESGLAEVQNHHDDENENEIEIEKKDNVVVTTWSSNLVRKNDNEKVDLDHESDLELDLVRRKHSKMALVKMDELYGDDDSVEEDEFQSSSMTCQANAERPMHNDSSSIDLGGTKHNIEVAGEEKKEAEGLPITVVPIDKLNSEEFSDEIVNRESGDATLTNDISLNGLEELQDPLLVQGSSQMNGERRQESSVSKEAEGNNTPSLKVRDDFGFRKVDQQALVYKEESSEKSCKRIVESTKVADFVVNEVKVSRSEVDEIDNDFGPVEEFSDFKSPRGRAKDGLIPQHSHVDGMEDSASTGMDSHTVHSVVACHSSPTFVELDSTSNFVTQAGGTKRSESSDINEDSGIILTGMSGSRPETKGPSVVEYDMMKDEEKISLEEFNRNWEELQEEESRRSLLRSQLLAKRRQQPHRSKKMKSDAKKNAPSESARPKKSVDHHPKENSKHKKSKSDRRKTDSSKEKKKKPAKKKEGNDNARSSSVHSVKTHRLYVEEEHPETNENLVPQEKPGASPYEILDRAGQQRETKHELSLNDNSDLQSETRNATVNQSPDEQKLNHECMARPVIQKKRRTMKKREFQVAEV